MRTGLPKSGVAPRRADITTPRCQSRAAAPRPRKRSRHPHITALIVAERRHSAVTRYAERSAACRDLTRPCCRRAGGTPLLQSRSLTARAVSPPSPGASQMRYYPHSRSPTARAVTPSVNPPTASGGHSPRKNRRRAVSYVSTGLARLPRDTGGTRNYRRSAVVEICYTEACQPPRMRRRLAR